MKLRDYHAKRLKRDPAYAADADGLFALMGDDRKELMTRRGESRRKQTVVVGLRELEGFLRDPSQNVERLLLGDAGDRGHGGIVGTAEGCARSGRQRSTGGSADLDCGAGFGLLFNAG